MPDVIRVPVETEDGETREVEINPADHGLVPADDVMPRDRFQEELKRRLQGRYRVEEIAENDEALEALREQRPDLFRSDDDGDGGGGEGRGITEEDLDRIRQEWRKQELEPMAQTVEELEAENQRLRREELKRKALEAFDAVGVQKGLRPLVLEFYGNRDRVGFHEDDGEWYLKDGDHFLPSASEGARYVTIQEDLEKKKKSGEFADWFESTTREGAGFGGSSGSGGRPPVRSKADIKSRKQRIEFIGEHGVEAYEALPDE